MATVSGSGARKKDEVRRILQEVAAPPTAETEGYSPLDTSGNNYAKMAGMSELDYAALEAAKSSWNDANARGDTAGMDAAHRQAESIRALYDYSGGSDGSQYIPQDTFTYESAPTYASKYQTQIDELTDTILNRDAFTYDYAADPLYRQYAESYTREGQRAMQDTLAQVSARTGGLASSYATTAAQQANNYYMAQLADKIPELQQLAYSMYMDEGNTQRQNLNMLMALEQGDYAKYADLLSQYNADRSFAYGGYRDDIADRQWQQSFDYSAGRDAIADQRYENEWNYGVQQNERSEAQERISDYLAAGGSVANLDPALITQSGYTQAELAAIEMYYAQQAMLAASGGGGGRGGGGSSGGEDEDIELTPLNSHGESWIMVNGRRLSYAEVAHYVETGQIKETVNEENRTVRYSWVND